VAVVEKARRVLPFGSPRVEIGTVSNKVKAFGTVKIAPREIQKLTPAAFATIASSEVAH